MSKNLGKALSLVLIVLLLFASIAGCSGGNSGTTDGQKDSNETNNNTQENEKNPEQEEVAEEESTYDFGGRTIRFVAQWQLEPVAGSTEGADKLIARTAEMEEKYNFKLEYIEMPDIYEKYTASVLAGDPVGDIVFMSSRLFYPGLVSAGMVYPVSDLGIFDFSEEKWNQDIIDFATFSGKVYGFHTGRTEPRGGLFWNKTMFEREGFPNLYDFRDNKTWTWDKFLEIAIKATKDLDGDGTIDQWGFMGDGPEPAILMSNGAAIVKKDESGKPIFTLNDPNAIEALQFFQDLVIKHKVMHLPPAGSEWDYALQQFTDGRIAMLYAEWWATDGWFSQNMADDYGYTFMPMGPAANDYVVKQGELTFPIIPIGVEKPEEIAIVFDEYTDPFPDDDPEAWKEGYERTARDAESIETIRQLQDNQLSQLDIHRSFPAVEQIMWDVNWRVYSGNSTPQVAVEEYAQQIQAILDDAWKDAAK